MMGPMVAASMPYNQINGLPVRYENDGATAGALGGLAAMGAFHAYGRNIANSAVGKGASMTNVNSYQREQVAKNKDFKMTDEQKLKRIERGKKIIGAGQNTGKAHNYLFNKKMGGGGWKAAAGYAGAAILGSMLGDVMD